MADKKLMRMDSKDRLNRIDELGEKYDTSQKDSLILQRTQAKETQKLDKKQLEKNNRLEDQKAHDGIGEAIEDAGIQAGQALGLSVNTTTDYAMGAQDAAVNLFSSNEAIVEYYKNYDANREKKKQQVASVYSRELSQDNAVEKLTLSKRQAKQTQKKSEEAQDITKEKMN